jgi:hypothetical protein
VSLRNVATLVLVERPSENRPVLGVRIAIARFVPLHGDPFFRRLDELDGIPRTQVEHVETVVRAIAPGIRRLRSRRRRIGHQRAIGGEAHPLRHHTLEDLPDRPVIHTDERRDLFVRDIPDPIPCQEVVARILDDDRCVGEFIER